MKLLNPTDTELNREFALRIAGWKQVWKSRLGDYLMGIPKDDFGTPITGEELPRFTTSADAVLPWLQKELLWNCQGVGAQSKPGVQYFLKVLVEGEPRYYVEGRDDSFSKAAVLALLRAHGVEIEFSK